MTPSKLDGVEYSVTTNNHWRDVVYGYELTPAERAEFDYIDWNAVEAGCDNPSFVRYKGELHDLSEFELTTLPGWQGYRSDSFFSGLAIRYSDDFERVVVALILS